MNWIGLENRARKAALIDIMESKWIGVDWDRKKKEENLMKPD